MVLGAWLLWKVQGAYLTAAGGSVFPSALLLLIWPLQHAQTLENGFSVCANRSNEPGVRVRLRADVGAPDPCRGAELHPSPLLRGLQRVGACSFPGVSQLRQPANVD